MNAALMLGGLYHWIVLQRAFAMMRGGFSILHAFPVPPLWLVSILDYSLLVGTPLAIVLLTLSCRRISLPLWIVIAPLLLFDVWNSLTPITNLLWESGWEWPRRSWFTHNVSIYTGRAMIPVTLAAFVTLLLIRRKVPPGLWLVIVPTFALNLWFIWGWLDLQ